MTGFLPISHECFLKELCSMKNSGCHGNQSKIPIKISSQTINWIALLFYLNVPLLEVYRILLKKMIRQKTWFLWETHFPFYYGEV